MKQMYAVIWNFLVREGREAEFERFYGPKGEWDALFRRGAGYLGTELYRAERTPQRYITIDRWISSGAFETFRQENLSAYEALDALGDALIESETYLGGFLGG